MATVITTTTASSNPGGNNGNKAILVIAGSDPSGGAGLEADQKVIAAHDCYAMTATTALTSQNTTGVDGIHLVPADFTRKQIDAVFRDIRPAVVKSGMLASTETIEMLARALKDYDIKSFVLDPVMVATTGSRLLPAEALDSLRTLLLPRAFIVTPNIPEALLLASSSTSSSSSSGSDNEKQQTKVSTIADLETLARQVQAHGPQYVLVKGGHAPFQRDGTLAESDGDKQIVVDVLLGPDGNITHFTNEYQDSKNTHGTGCSLASAIASNLALGSAPVDAVRAAIRYVEAGIRTAPGLGQGNGPLNHFHSVSVLPFAPGRFLEYLLNRPDVAPVWHEFVHHPFVLAMGNGELPLGSFKGYLVQDYLYLVHFARANALASYKAKNIADIAAGAKIVSHIHTEMSLHINYCASFGISTAEIEATQEHQACTAYTRYVLDVGASEDWLGLQVALAPCLLGYGAIAQMLYADQERTRRDEGNTYWPWILNYVAEDYVAAVKTGSELIERHASLQSPTRIEELVKIFIHATKMEIGFWEMFPSS